jgi:hypothetical protein
LVIRKLAPELEALNDVLMALSSLGTNEDKQWVLETAASRVGVVLTRSILTLGNTSDRFPAISADSPKEFMRSKAPKNDVQRAACLAYFLAHSRKTAQFKAADVATLNTEAAGPKTNMSRAVNNATIQNRYLAPAGKGTKQITALGEDVVNALPDQVAVKAAEQAEGRKPKKKKKKAKVAKASQK